MTVQVGSPSAIADFQFDFSSQLPEGVSLTPNGVAHTPSDPRVVVVAETTDVAQKRSTVRVNQAALPHGSLYTMNALATLTNGEQIPGSFTRRVFAGASA